MRNLVISLITEYLETYTNLMYELDTTPAELDSMSNADLLDLLVEILEIIME